MLLTPPLSQTVTPRTPSSVTQFMDGPRPYLALTGTFIIKSRKYTGKVILLNFLTSFFSKCGKRTKRLAHISKTYYGEGPHERSVFVTSYGLCVLRFHAFSRDIIW